MPAFARKNRIRLKGKPQPDAATIAVYLKEEQDPVQAKDLLADEFREFNVNVETINDDPRVIQVGMRIEATWVDRNGAPLMQRQLLRICPRNRSCDVSD